MERQQHGRARMRTSSATSNADSVNRRSALLGTLFGWAALAAACGGSGGDAASPQDEDATPSPPAAPPGATLGELAAAMSPGTWAKLDVGNQDPVLGVGSISGTMLHYCNSMPWNPLSKAIEIVGADHNYPQLRHVRFDATSSQFVLVADNAGVGPGHGYDHVTLNPNNGDLYVRLYSGFTGKVSCMKKALGASSFTKIPDVAASDQVAMGTCWWPGAFTGGGAQGSLMVFVSGAASGKQTDGVI